MDLLIIFLTLALLNLFFGKSPYKYPLVWGTTVGLALILYFGKKNKPDHHLQHILQYYHSAGIFHAGAPDTEYRPFLEKEKE